MVHHVASKRNVLYEIKYPVCHARASRKRSPRWTRFRARPSLYPEISKDMARNACRAFDDYGRMVIRPAGFSYYIIIFQTALFTYEPSHQTFRSCSPYLSNDFWEMGYSRLPIKFSVTCTLWHKISIDTKSYTKKELFNVEMC